MTTDRQQRLEAVVKDQQELLRLALYVATQGPTTYQDEHMSCTMGDAKLKTSQHIAMCAGQSVNTIVTCAAWRGIPVRDLYPVARSAVESFINAAYLIAEEDEVAERAVRWVRYRAWKEVNRNIGSGEFMLRLSTEPEATAPAEFSEFTGKGCSREWSTLDTPGRFRRVGEIAGKKAGSRLLAGYALVYSTSSEIIHGSPFGVNYFYQAHMQPNGGVDDFREATRVQLEDLMIAVAHGQAGYLHTFFQVNKLRQALTEEQHIFNRLLALEGVEAQQVEAP